jgi:DNA-binding response OmpR family regulator
MAAAGAPKPAERSLHWSSYEHALWEKAMTADASGETLSILVVEDEVAVAELIRTILNQEPGWGATVVHDAAAAREVFRHVRIEVLVVDVNLPGISGLELLELLRKDPHWDEPPVLLMSAHPEQAGVATAIRDGLVTRFLKKPFDIDELINEVREAVATQAASTARGPDSTTY